MRRKIATTLASAVLACAGIAAAPQLPGDPVLSPLARAQAAVTKSLTSQGGGGGNLGGAGDRLGQLVSGWAVPVLIVIGGCLLLGALVSRNVGTCVSVVIVTLVGLIFFLSPSSIEGAAKQIAGIVF
jgi:hypothetical protein